jgi:hypothetical protein
MSQLHQMMLARKRAALAHMRSTVNPEANIQTASSKGWQQDSAYGLAYPAEAAAPIELVRYQMPNGITGALTGLVIAHIGASGSFTDNSGQVVWHVLKNGFPVYNLGNIYVQIGQTNAPAGMYLLLQQNDLVQVLAECPTQAAPVGTPFARLVGYTSFGGLGTYMPDGTRSNRRQAGAGANTISTGSSNGASAGAHSGGGSIGGNRTTQSSMA